MLQRVCLLGGFCLSLTLGHLLGFAQSEVVPTPTAQQKNASRFHSGWAALHPDGSLTGRAVILNGQGELSAQPHARVTLSRKLLPISTTQADADGNFKFTGLSQGVYEIASESDHSYAIVSFEAVADRTPSVMHVYASSMPRAAVDAVLKELWAPQEEAVGTPRFEDVMAPLIPGTQTQRVAIRGGKINGLVAFADSRNAPESHVVKAFSNGSLIDTAPVDGQGRFSLAIENPGPIDIVLGGSAYASLGFEAVDLEGLVTLQPEKNQSTHLVSMQDPANSLGVCDSLVVPAVGCGIAVPPPVAVEEGLPLASCEAAPMCGGFSPCASGYRGGGFGGGGGGGGEFGGMGSLLGIAGIALGAVALADDDDWRDDRFFRDSGFNPPLATPYYDYRYY